MKTAALHSQDAVWKLQRLLKDARGHVREAINEAIGYLQCGLPVPADIASIVTRATSFKQDRFGK